MWPPWIWQLLPIGIQVGAAIWFLAVSTTRLGHLTELEQDTQKALKDALQDISYLARQVAVNDSEHRAILERIAASERELTSLRDWRHSISGMQMTVAGTAEDLAELRERVDRIADRVR